MAIYTEYGRYLKAKTFKDSLSSTGGMYMLFGLGDPLWGAQYHDMPIAAYNTSIIVDQNIQNNQFKDSHVSMYHDTPSGVSSIGLTNGELTPNSYLSICKDIVPPFPSVWPLDEQPTGLFDEITSNNFHEHYITGSPGNYLLDGSTTVYLPSNPEQSVARQYFAEMFLRGIDRSIKNPVGLLGAIKCDVSFVVDIGQEEDGIYTGKENQFWYGDRFWESVAVNDYVSDNVDKFNPENIKYPHHLLFTSVINPRDLCATLSIDQYIVPMQIALYIKKTSGAMHYRVGENIFNFGQYTNEELSNLPNEYSNKVLNFTLKCRNNSSGDEWPSGDFEFVLNDYIKGSPRQPHTVDRIGYIVGF